MEEQSLFQCLLFNYKLYIT